MENCDFLYDGWVLRRVTNCLDVESFDCGDPHMTRYFREESRRYRKLLMVQSYHFCPAGYTEPEPVMLVDLCNDVIRRDNIGMEDTVTPDDSETLPAVKIARLGRNSIFKGNSLTPHLLNTLKAFFICNNRTGCRILTLDAYSTRVPLYQQCGFEPTLEAERENGKGDIVSMFFDLYPFDQSIYSY